jgi:hypothetical protein
MTSSAIHIFNRHVWTCLTLFSSAILNHAIVIHFFMGLCADKASERLFSTGLETSVSYTTVSKTYCLRIKLSVMFYSVLRSPELNSVNIKYPCFL